MNEFEGWVFMTLRDMQQKINNIENPSITVDIDSGLKPVRDELKIMKEDIDNIIGILKSQPTVTVRAQSIENTSSPESTELVVGGVSAPADKRSLLDRMKKMV